MGTVDGKTPTTNGKAMAGEYAYAFSVAEISTGGNRAYVLTINPDYADAAKVRLMATTKVTFNGQPVDAYGLAKLLTMDRPLGSFLRVKLWTGSPVNGTAVATSADFLSYAGPQPMNAAPTTATATPSTSTVCTIDPVTGAKTCTPTTQLTNVSWTNEDLIKRATPDPATGLFPDFQAPTWHYPPGVSMVVDANGRLVPSAQPTTISFPGGPYNQPWPLPGMAVASSGSVWTTTSEPAVYRRGFRPFRRNGWQARPVFINQQPRAVFASGGCATCN